MSQGSSWQRTYHILPRLPRLSWGTVASSLCWPCANIRLCMAQRVPGMTHAYSVSPFLLLSLHVVCFLWRDRVRVRARGDALSGKGQPLRLPASEVERFYTLHPALLLYANQQLGLAPSVTTIPQLLAMPEAERYELRSAFYKYRHLLEAFVHDNPQRFSVEDLAIVESWKHLVQGQFYVFRHLQQYTVFLDVGPPPKAYGVLALHDDFADVFPRVPLLIETVLLPFKHQIIYDGQCQYYNIFFGRGITRDLQDSYQRAQAQYGIITSLPFAAPAAAQSEEAQLKFYLRNAQHRERYWEEIVALRQQSRSLETLYHQGMGKVHARTYSLPLRDMGLSGVWFAIREGVTIASGTTRQEVEQAVQRIVPKDKLPFIYVFQVKEAATRRGAKRSAPL